MLDETLYQIAITVFIIAGLFLILVLWRCYDVLTDVKDSTKIVKRRIKEIDQLVKEAQNSIEKLGQILSSFAGSFEKITEIRNKVGSLWEKNKKGNKDE